MSANEPGPGAAAPPSVEMLLVLVAPVVNGQEKHRVTQADVRAYRVYRSKSHVVLPNDQGRTRHGR
jgi:hypothetical protein